MSDEPDFAAVAPFDGGELRAVFGTDRPSTQQIRDTDVLGRFDPVMERWEGRYLVSYDGDRPDRLWFLGYSGD